MNGEAGSETLELVGRAGECLIVYTFLIIKFSAIPRHYADDFNANPTDGDNERVVTVHPMAQPLSILIHASPASIVCPKS